VEACFNLYLMWDVATPGESPLRCTPTSIKSSVLARHCPGPARPSFSCGKSDLNTTACGLQQTNELSLGVMACLIGKQVLSQHLGSALVS
jgi:hypothetical protein